MYIAKSASRPHELKFKPKEKRLNIWRMRINIKFLQSQRSYISIDGRKEGRMDEWIGIYKTVLLEVGREMFMPFVSLSVNFQLKSVVEFCPSHYNLLPLDTHHIHNTLLCITDLTKNHTPPLSAVCTYRALLLLIVFVR